ncbi:MAG: disulfide bond formation protein B [Gammaproteobacteria bacterium]|nr:disulfide bond formation protein B [Gammaproteobacteria bacterium]
MKSCNPRLIYLIGFISICALLGLATYLENYQGMIPCSLCLFQRFILAFLGVVLFFGATLNLKSMGRIIVSFFTIFVSAVGMVFAGRQAWLQHLPPNQDGDCGASLQYLVKVFPIDQVIKKVFIGGTECSRVDWQFLNFSLAEWSLAFFTLFCLLGCWEFLQTWCKKSCASR